MDLCYIVDGVPPKQGKKVAQSANYAENQSKAGTDKVPHIGSSETPQARGIIRVDNAKSGDTGKASHEVTLNNAETRVVDAALSSSGSFNPIYPSICIQQRSESSPRQLGSGLNGTFSYLIAPTQSTQRSEPPGISSSVRHKASYGVDKTDVQPFDATRYYGAKSRFISQQIPMQPTVFLEPPTPPFSAFPPPQNRFVRSTDYRPPQAGPSNSTMVANNPGSDTPPGRIVVVENRYSCKAEIDVETRQYKCSHCERAFSRRSDLVRHFQIHLGAKPNLCSTCGKAFIQRSALTVHQRTHTGEKPYKCQVCGRMFSDSSSIARHRRIHQRHNNGEEAGKQGRKDPQSKLIRDRHSNGSYSVESTKSSATSHNSIIPRAGRHHLGN